LRVVIRGHQYLGWLDHVRAQQQRIACTQLLTYFAQHGNRIVPFEVADARTQIQDQLAPGNLAQKMKAIAEIGHHRQYCDIWALSFDSVTGMGQGAGGNVHRKIFDTQLTPSKSVQQSSGLSRRACAEFND
jgi:hypothetical protein